MNNLVLIREKIKRAERLNKAQILATKNGEFTPYNPPVFELRQKQARKDMEALNSLTWIWFLTFDWEGFYNPFFLGKLFDNKANIETLITCTAFSMKINSRKLQLNREKS